MSKLMDYNIGDQIKFIANSAFGEIKAGSTGTISEDYGDAILIKLDKIKGTWKAST